MSEHRAQIRWRRTSADFSYDGYNRAHDVLFKNGAIALPASSAPAFRGDADRVDPEESFVASLSSCHMLTFLAICARKRAQPQAVNAPQARGSTAISVCTELAMKHSSWARWWSCSSSAAVGALPPPHTISGDKVTLLTQKAPRSFFAITPTAWSR